MHLAVRVQRAAAVEAVEAIEAIDELNGVIAANELEARRWSDEYEDDDDLLASDDGGAMADLAHMRSQRLVGAGLLG